MKAQNEITTRGPLLAETGELAQKGYSKFPVLDYNPERVNVLPGRLLNRLRLKEWDYYGVTTKSNFFSVAVSNEGYIGLVFAYFIDFETKFQCERIIVTPFGRGCTIPHTSAQGDIVFTHGGVRISFKREKERRVIDVEWPKFYQGHKLTASFVARQPDDMESIVMATPIGRRHFYYNHKVNCMPTSGRMSLGGRVIEYDESSALTTLDWGRGAWEYRTFWNWASASYRLPDGRAFGLNLGKGFGDLSHATENCVFIDGRMTKYGAVGFEYDPSDYNKPWTFSSDDGRLNLVLTPFFERITDTNLLVLKTKVHQMFGNYSGRVVLDSGEAVEIKNLVGWAEEHRALW